MYLKLDILEKLKMKTWNQYELFGLCLQFPCTGSLY